MVVCTSHLLDQPSISICLLGVSKTSGPGPPDLGLFPHSEGSLFSTVLWDHRPCHSWCLFSLSSSLLLRVWIFFFNLQTLSGSIKLSASLWPLSLLSFAWTTSVTSQLVSLKLLQLFLTHELLWSTRIPNLIRSDHDTLPLKPRPLSPHTDKPSLYPSDQFSLVHMLSRPWRCGSCPLLPAELSPLCSSLTSLLPTSCSRLLPLPLSPNAKNIRVCHYKCICVNILSSSVFTAYQDRCCLFFPSQRKKLGLGELTVHS